MIAGQILILEDGLYVLTDSGADGDALVFEATGLSVKGQTVFRLVPGSSAALAGHWEPLTNGDPDNPELLFYNGDVLLYFVAD